MDDAINSGDLAMEVTKAPVVTDEKSAKEFILWCLDRLGLGYHPDTLFEEYVNDASEPTFAADEVKYLNEQNAALFEHIDPYDVGLAEMRARMGYEPESDAKM